MRVDVRWVRGLLCLLLAMGGGGLAAAESAPLECLGAASSTLGRRFFPVWHGFLDRGDVGTFLLPPPRRRGECVGLLVVAPPRLVRLRIWVLSPSGLELRHVESSGHAYLRHCGNGGERLALRAEEGRGEVRVVALEGKAPPALPDLNRRVGRCFAGGGVEQPLAEVGRDPRLSAGGSIERGVRRWRERLGELGYHLSETPLSTSDAMRSNVRLQGRLPPCGGLLLVGSGALLDVDLTVKDAAGSVLGRDTAPRRDAWVPLCGPSTARAATADVRVARGRGRWGVFLATLRSLPPGTPPPGVSGRNEGAWWEAAHLAAARGQHIEPLGWLHLPRGGSYRWPVPLPGPGRCASFGAVPGDAGRAAGFQVALIAQDGRLLAFDAGSRGMLRLLVCGAPSAKGWLDVRAVGGAGAVLPWRAAEGGP